MDIYTNAVSLIIRQQSTIIGPLAIDQARKVAGLEIVGENEFKLSGNGKQILEKLVQEYSRLFGQASIEACKDAIKEIQPAVPADQLPEILR